MLDDPKPLPAGASRKRFPPRRFYIVANPNEETADTSTSSFYPLPPLPSTPIQHPGKPTPSPPQPSPINTDNLKQRYQPRYNPSDRTLSSPSTPTSSPALESTPPPSTPGQKSIPSIDLAQGSDRDNGQTPLISRTDNFVKKITAPFSHARRKSSGNNVQSATGSPPIHHDQTSSQTQKSSPCLSETRVFVTADSGIFKVVDITGARDAAFIRERIFADMQISDENQTHFSIYRTEVGSYAIGDALTDEHLFELCRDFGDAYASLKFMVSHTSAAVHESPLDASYSQKFYTIPPPVVVPRSNDVYSPVRTQHRCGSPPRSLSSASERLPQESGGYDASVSDDNADAPERDPNRATIKPGSFRTAQRAAPPSVQLQSPSTVIERGRTETAPLRIEKHHQSSHTPQPLSPGSSRFPFMEDNYTPPPRRAPQIVSSDAALERERALEDSETKLELAGQRRVQQETEEREKQRTREREREREVQRRPQPKSRGEHWTVIPSDIPHSDYKKERPTMHDGPRSPPPRRGQGYNDYSSRNTPSEGRSSRRMVGTPVPANWTMPWIASGGKTEPKMSPTSPSLTYRGNRSMGDLRAAASKHPAQLQPGKRGPPPPLPVARPATSSMTQELTESNGVQPVPRSFDSRNNLISPVSSTTRPLPVAGNSTTSSASITGPLGLTSPQEPCSRPRSAVGNTSASPQSSGRVQSPTHQVEPNSQARSPPSALSPHPYRYNHETGFSNIIPKIVPPSPRSDDRTTETLHDRGIGNAILREPPSPATPSSPRYSASSEPSPGGIASPGDGGSAESTLKGQQRYPWLGDPTGSSTVTQVSAESTMMPPRKERPDIKPLPQRPTQAPIPQAHPYPTPPPLPLPPYPIPLSDIPSITTPTSTSISTSHSQPPLPKPIPHPPTPTSLPLLGPLKSIPSDDDSDSGSNAGGTLWAISDNTGSTLGTWETTPQSDRRKSLPRLVVDPGAPQIHPQKSSGPVPLPQVPQVPPPEYPPAARRPPKPPTKPSFGLPSNHRTSVFNEDFRPPAEEMYERLGDFFPGHDLDEPVIEASSGGTSPTSAEAAQPFPTPDRRKHKKSIRVVAYEHKRKLDRTSRITSANNANMLRKRSTKLWGGRMEEVTAEQSKNSSPALSTPAESPSEPKPIFRWVRGELIGRGTYGKVYVALNATTGELIAVKQVEIPRTENDRNDSRQVTVVEALKLESETLKDLDHPNVVQYLGFEETPSYLSIFLEYVPGGSIASILRKHGRFSENVVKLFTSQILDGLDYLHSKRVIHRDLKADNILVEEAGHCKITDFGISKRTDDINMIGAHTSMQGSIFWMAPEVVNGQKKGYNSKIDIWSVGCVMFEMWTGERPWSGQEAVAVLLQLYQSKLGPPLPEDVTLSPQANDLRKLCFAMNPDERPTAAELRKHEYLKLPPGWEFTGYS